MINLSNQTFVIKYQIYLINNGETGWQCDNEEEQRGSPWSNWPIQICQNKTTLT